MRNKKLSRMHNRKISEGEPQPADTVKHLLPLEITDLVPQQRNRDRFSLFHKETFLLGVSTDTLTRFQIGRGTDRKSTRLNSSHVAISYAVFCLKKKKK